jgi:hypothetical protein
LKTQPRAAAPDDKVAMICIAVVSAFSAVFLFVAVVVWLVNCKIKDNGERAPLLDGWQHKTHWLCYMPFLALLFGLVAEVWRCALASIDAQDGSIDWSLSAYLFDFPGILMFVSVALFKFCLTEQEAGDDHTRTLLRAFQAMSCAVLSAAMICGVAVGSSTTSVADPDERVRSLWVLLTFGVAYLLLSLQVFGSAYNLRQFNAKLFNNLTDKPKLLHKCGALLVNVILGACLFIRGAMCLSLAVTGVLTANPPHFKSTAGSSIATPSYGIAYYVIGDGIVSGCLLALVCLTSFPPDRADQEAYQSELDKRGQC